MPDCFTVAGYEVFGGIRQLQDGELRVEQGNIITR
jgi:hypothetical protein